MPQQDSQISLYGANILAVDDMSHNLDLLSRMLSKQGYKVRTASNGRMALASAQMYPPDLILLDIRMPDMDGYEVCSRLKDDPDLATIPVIFISASDHVAGKVEAFSVGGVDYINKPFELVEVLARVETHLRMRSLQQQLEQQKNLLIAQNISLQQRISELTGDNHELYEALSEAVMQEKLQVYYQPIVNLQSRKAIGFEALLRWQHPEFGFIPPSQFIPLAESTGLIYQLGDWVIAEASKQLGIWSREFPNLANMTMNINVSAKQLGVSAMQLGQSSLVEHIQKSVQDANIDFSQLKLEITESAVMDNQPEVIKVLGELKDLGVSLCIDDFGTGYSSLRRLHDFPIDTLKIDQSFIRQGEWVIVNAICQLAIALNMQVVPEGIETEVQLSELLKTNVCHHGQGYLFDKPMPVNLINELLKREAS
jgi:diguanylate cyclase